jgi:hypothetical protein
MATVDMRTPPPWLPYEWSIFSKHEDSGLAEMVNKTTGLLSLTKISYASIIVNNKETISYKAWYTVGITDDGQSIEMFNPISGEVKLLPNPEPLPLRKPATPVSIKSGFAAPVEGVKAPETDKSIKVASQKTVNASAESSVSTASSNNVPSVTSTISTSAILEGAVIGTGLTGTIGVGTVVGGVVGAIASCIDPPALPDYASKLTALESSIDGVLKKLEKTPFVQGLESIGDDIEDFVGDAEAWVTDAIGDISGLIDDAANSVSNLIDSAMSSISNEVNKLPDPSEIFGIEGIPCPGTVKKDKEDAQAKADAAVAKETETNAISDEKVQSKNVAISEVIANLDKAGIVYTTDNTGIPRITSLKAEISKGNISPDDREGAFKVLTLYAPLWEWTKQYSPLKWESNCRNSPNWMHSVCAGSKITIEKSREA